MNAKSSFPRNSRETRRSFLRKAGAATAAVGTMNVFPIPIYGQTQAPSANVIGANNRIAIAYIGTGSQGMHHVRSLKPLTQDYNVVQAAVCDVYKKRLNAAREFLGLREADAFGDHRKMLERKDIDAVLIATPDNWHAQASLDALESGKHVYCEKPMTRYLGEAFAVYDMVKKTGKMFVVGSQGCADPKWHKAAEWIKAGKIGPLVWGQSSYCRNNINNSEWTYPVEADANESNLDWKRWLGKAPQIPFNAEHYFCWHKYYTYNSGIIGNLLPHRFQPMMLATGNPEFPRRVVATGTRKVSTDRDITDTTHLLAEFPSGLTLMVVGSTVNELGLPDTLRGRKGTLQFVSSQNRVQLQPERIFADELGLEEFSDPLPTEKTERLTKNLIDCIRSGQKPVADIELTVRVQTVLSLAEMSERLGLALFFDEKSRKVKTADGKEVPPLSYDSSVPPMPG